MVITINNFNIYLAGRCKGLSVDEQNSWRDKTIYYFNTRCLSVIAHNPNDYFNYYSNLHKTNKQVKEFYMSLIDRCDLVIANLNDSCLSVGTGQELEHARMKGIPIIGFGTENVYPWLAEVDCQVVFDTLDECLDYVKDYYLREDSL